ncbi:MAG: DUF192 domain-containing protein [Spirochaetia bacterium]
MNYRHQWLGFFFIIWLSSCSAQSKIEIALGSRIFSLEVARTPAEREKGLMFRKFLHKDAGMIFIFDEDEIRGFWMKNTNVALSIAYISAEGNILEIYDMQPHSLASIVSRRPFRYAIEVNQGEFEKAGLTIGTRIDLSILQTLTNY